MTTVRIALANIRCAATPDESVSMACTAVERASAEGASGVCFPECYVPGYRAPGKTLPPPDAAFLERAWSAVAEAAAAGNVAVVLGCAGDGSPITSAVVRPDGAVLAWQPYGVEGLLLADLETDEPTGLLAARLRSA